MAFDTTGPARFFVLTNAMDSPHDNRYDTDDSIHLGDAPRCPLCDGVIGSLTWQAPYRVTLEFFRDLPGDFARGSGDERLIPERFAKAILAEGLTGFEGFHPVEVVKTRYPKGRGKGSAVEIPRYVMVAPRFGRGKVDVILNRMRVKAPPSCSECAYASIQAIHGFVLEPGSWGGEDVFRPRGLYGKILVSERFKGLVERHGLTNMVLTPTEEYVSDPSNLGPAPLPRA